MPDDLAKMEDRVRERLMSEAIDTKDGMVIVEIWGKAKCPNPNCTYNIARVKDYKYYTLDGYCRKCNAKIKWVWNEELKDYELQKA
jgi:hypothetical protein